MGHYSHFAACTDAKVAIGGVTGPYNNVPTDMGLGGHDENTDSCHCRRTGSGFMTIAGVSPRACVFGLGICLLLCQAQAFEFGWGRQASALVTTQTEKQGVKSKGSFRIEFSEAAGGGMYRLEFHDADIHHIEGLSDDELATLKESPEYRTSVAVMPSMLISVDGHFLQIVSYREIVDNLESAWDMPGSVKAYLERPDVRAAMESRIAGYWELWVGLATRVGLSAGESETFHGVTKLSGVDVPYTTRVSHFGEDESCPRGIRLHTEVSYSGEDLSRAIYNSMVAMTEHTGEMTEEVSLEEINAQKRIVSELVTDGTTLRPCYATSTEFDEIRISGAEDHRQKTVHTFDFDWSDE